MDNIIREALLNENSTLTPDSIAYLTEAITDRIADGSGDTLEHFLILNFFAAGSARRVTRAVNEARIAI